MGGFKPKQKAKYLGDYTADTFEQACKLASISHGLQELYVPKDNSIFGCKLFNNEADARRSFG
tara:strand:- start:870 stop:1058 length:189 start_codon:yes stop_codon:yes gene_type:complete